jgi:hypothetical protein
MSRLAPTTDARNASPWDREFRISSKTKFPLVCTSMPFELQEHIRALIDLNPKAFRDRSRNFMVVFSVRAARSFSAPDSPKWLFERFKFLIEVLRRRLSHNCRYMSYLLLLE